MINKFDQTDRRILKFPAVNPCQDISPATLLNYLIGVSKIISNYGQTKSFATQRKNAREIIRQVSILSIFFEEIKDHVVEIPDSVILSLSELHLVFQKIQFLLEDCTREGARTWILMKSYSVTMLFRALVRSLATALDVLPIDSMEMVSFEVKELVELLSKQARKARIEVDCVDEETTKRVILVLNQFENKFDPDPFLVRRILAHLDVNTWVDCHKEIKFLDEEIRMRYLEGDDEREIPLLSSLVGLLNYCRGILFEDSEFVEHSNERNSNVERLACLNPEDFQCPISLELMTDPVTISTGQTYDRASIQKWLKSGNLTCPKTGEKLMSTELVPNASLKKLIQQFCAEYGVCLTKSRKKSRDISRTILPGSPANAEAMKFLSEFLALRLCYGTSYQQNKAANEIKLLAKSNLFNRSCLIDAGAIPPLLEMLDSSDPSMQENAVSALLKLTKLLSGQKEIIAKGGLRSVVRVLKNGLKLEARQISAAVVFYLSSVHDHRKMIGENGETIRALLKLIEEGTTYGQKNSVVAIFALLLYHRNRQRALAAGAVPVLLGLLANSDSSDELKTDTLAVLSMLADGFNGSMEIQQHSALPLIARLLQSIETRAGKEYCVSVLHSLCVNCGADVVSVLAKDEALMAALYLLLTDGTSHASRKSRELIKMLQRFGETRGSSSLARGVRHEQQFVGVR